MAVVRPSRSAPPVALITFVFLFLVSTGLAIYFGLMWSSEAAARQAADDTLATVMKPNEKALKDAAIAGVPGKPSAIGELSRTNNALRDIIAGPLGKSESADEIIKSAQAAMKGNGTNLIDTAKILADRADRAQKLYDEANGQTRMLDANFQRVFDQEKSNAAALQTQINAAKQALNDKDADIGKVNDHLRLELQKATDEADSKAREDEKTIRQMANERQALEELVERLRKELHDIKEPPIKNNDSPILWQADGRVLRTPIGTDEVWINIGRRDHVTVNLTFAVYDPKLGVGSGPESRGKGAIEVTQVGETESLAHITHTEPGETILQNDVIANVVFNPKVGGVTAGDMKRAQSKVYRFYVYGDFDLDGDGISTPSERDHVIRQIQAWGGQVVDKLDPQTDFLVLGSPPGGSNINMGVTTAPATGPDAATQTSELEDQQKAEREKYVKLLVTAKDYAIPVLDANRFFAYIGYYNNTIVGKKPSEEAAYAPSVNK